MNQSDAELLSYFQPLRSDYSEWASARRAQQDPPTRDLLPVDAAVDEVAGDLGVERAELDFSLTLREIPVEGKFWHQVNADTVLASSELLRSPVVLTSLVSIIRDLAIPASE